MTRGPMCHLYKNCQPIIILLYYIIIIIIIIIIF